MRLSDSSKMPTQPLRARLADMQRSANRTYRRNPVRCQVSREHHCGALAERISRGAIAHALGVAAGICPSRMTVISEFLQFSHLEQLAETLAAMRAIAQRAMQAGS